jgi:hypothetical protein
MQSHFSGIEPAPPTSSTVTFRPLNFLARLFGRPNGDQPPAPTTRPSVGEFMSCVRAAQKSQPVRKPSKDQA